VPVWGTAAPGEAITVTFAGQTVFGAADEHGRWQVELAPLEASREGRELTVAGADAATPVVIKNVVVGEVWLLSGQSNMQWEIGQTRFYGLEKETADYPLIREIQLARENNYYPLIELPAPARAWRACSPDTVGNFSAAGFFFGRKLFEELQVPIGLLNAALGGTRIETWMAPESFSGDPVLEKGAKDANEYNLRISEGRERFLKKLAERGVWENDAREAIAAGRLPTREPEALFRGNIHQTQRPSALFNSMIYPLVPHAFRGVIWYQGENNGGEDDPYLAMKKALINGWRDLWGRGDFPFYYAQISSIQQPTRTIRPAAAYSCRFETPSCGPWRLPTPVWRSPLISTKSRTCILTTKRMWANAWRCGRWRTTMAGILNAADPIFREQKTDGNTIRLFFDHTGGGLMVGRKEGLKPAEEVVGGELKHFAVAGPI
jgi:sialate O-acetylesterase